ncbi:MAG: transposase [Gemmatimonadetes bacterium]|nr:transposase [Gemmatimonadota bacterium]MYD64036.1 transposase [Gemmatimonadota bacterium]
MDKTLLELYSDYLLSSFGATTATGLSALLEGAISHDRVTRFLSQSDYNGKTLWRHVKGMIREIEQDDGVLIFDDTIQEKPYTDENDLICWHYDHSQNRTVKGINLLNCVYHAGAVSLPVTYELITKPILYTDVKTRRVKRMSLVTKNDLMRDMVSVCKRNRIKYRYVLADSWFSAKENLQFIRNSMNKHFVIALKSNRTVALSYEDKRQGRFARIDAQNLAQHNPVQAYIKGLDFPVLLYRQVFTNKDGSTGEMFIACSDLTCDGETIETIYQKRWKVETFHKTLKSNAALSKSPTRRVRTQSNHCFMAIYAAARLEGLRVKHHLNHFALRSKLYLRAIRYAFDELQNLKAA